ncbi:hypothetical protein [Caballeronia pedi]|uniref:hypothetical protein n=1 Tax=Caballeronia pedi TaxID=1777141 RepID=UPI0007724335|nr:hypothetical protein [Caballeronia pedi]
MVVPDAIYTQSIQNLIGLRMARASAVETKKLQLTVDLATDHVIGEIVSLGLHGTNKAEVACSIIRMWLWDNQGKLRDNGINLRRKGSSQIENGGG